MTNYFVEKVKMNIKINEKGNRKNGKRITSFRLNGRLVAYISSVSHILAVRQSVLGDSAESNSINSLSCWLCVSRRSSPVIGIEHFM